MYGDEMKGRGTEREITYRERDNAARHLICKICPLGCEKGSEDTQDLKCVRSGDYPGSSGTTAWRSWCACLCMKNKSSAGSGQWSIQSSILFSLWPSRCPLEAISRIPPPYLLFPATGTRPPTVVGSIGRITLQSWIVAMNSLNLCNLL